MLSVLRDTTESLIRQQVKKLKGDMIINADEYGFCRTWHVSTNSLMFADEIASLVDKGNCAVEFSTFNILLNSAPNSVLLSI